MKKYVPFLTALLALLFTACNRGERTPTPIGLWVCDDPQISIEIKSEHNVHFGSYVEDGVEHAVMVGIGIGPGPLSYYIRPLEAVMYGAEQFFEGGYTLSGDTLTINLIRDGKALEKNAVFTKVADYEVPDDWEEVNRERQQRYRWYVPELWPNAERMFIFYGSEKNRYLDGEKIYVNGIEDIAGAAETVKFGDLLFFFKEGAAEPYSAAIVKGRENGDIFFSFDIDAKKFDGVSLAKGLEDGERAVIVRILIPE